MYDIEWDTILWDMTYMKEMDDIEWDTISNGITNYS